MQTLIDSPALSPPDSRMSLTLAQRMLLGVHLASLREARELTQLEVARDALGFEVSHAAVSRLERGVLEEVDSGRLELLATYYDTTVEELLEAIDERGADDEPVEGVPVEQLNVTPTVGKRLAHLRQAAGISLTEMALALGYAASSNALLRDWERGKFLPKPNTLFHIATRFSVSAAWLITGHRTKPSAPSMSMRLRALQKVYGLSNQELAHLAGLDVETGRSTVARYTRKHIVNPDPEVLRSLACALDVPPSWLVPPQRGYVDETALPKKEGLSLPGGLSRKAENFLLEIAELFLMGTLSESEIGSMRSALMKQKMLDLLKAARCVAKR